MIQKSTLNALHNVSNRYQGDSKRVLCICSAGLLRSPTTAAVLHKTYGYNTRSAGIEDYALIPVSQALLEWADEVVCMEKRHAFLLENDPLYPVDPSFQLHVLDVPDNYEYMDEQLQSIILERYTKIQE